MPTDEYGRHVCTPDDPWAPEKGDRRVHPDAECVGDRDFGDGECCEVIGFCEVIARAQQQNTNYFAENNYFAT